MRLFIFNNNKLKFVFQKKYYDQDNLYFTFQTEVEAQIGQDSRKKLLWATAKRAMKAMVFSGSKSLMTGSGRIFKSHPTSQFDLKAPFDAYDFYLDRGTGWCAMTMNYSIYKEAADNGNIPDKKGLIQTVSPLAWKDFSSNFLFFNTSGATDFVNKLMNGDNSIIPFAANNFYGTGISMSSNNFLDLVKVTTKVTNTVWAISLVEWPGMLYDQSYKTWYTDPQDEPKELDQAYDAIIRKGEINNITYQDSQHTGGKNYLQKLKDVEAYLVVLYRQMRFLSTCQNFDKTDVDLVWYEKALFVLSKLLTLVVGSTSVSGISLSALNTAMPGVKAGISGGNLAKELTEAISNYFYNKQRAIGQLGGKAVDVSTAFDYMMDTLIIAYSSYEIFLSKYRITELVTGRSQEAVNQKLVKVLAFVQAKNKKVGRPDIEEIMKEIDSQVNPPKTPSYIT